MKAKGAQFHKRTSTGFSARNEEWTYGGQAREEYHGKTSSTAYTYSPHRLGEVAASLEVTHNPATSYTHYPPSDMLNPTEPGEYDVNEWYPTTGQLPLFTHTSSKPYDVATGMGSTKASRVPAMTMLGLAANDAAARGVSLHPSRNLSEHSLNMVQHLASRGGIGADEVPRNVGNSSTFWKGPNTDNPMAHTSSHGDRQSHGYEKLDPETVKAGQRTLRSILGRNKTSTDEQGRLF